MQMQLEVEIDETPSKCFRFLRTPPGSYIAVHLQLLYGGYLTLLPAMSRRWYSRLYSFSRTCWSSHVAQCASAGNTHKSSEWEDPPPLFFLHDAGVVFELYKYWMFHKASFKPFIGQVCSWQPPEDISSLYSVSNHLHSNERKLIKPLLCDCTHNSNWKLQSGLFVCIRMKTKTFSSCCEADPLD